MNSLLKAKEATEIKSKTMTIKEVSNSFNCSEDTITRAVNKLWPNKIKNGIKTILNEREVTEIKLTIDKNYSLRNGAELPKTSIEKKLLIKQAIEFLNEDIEELKKQLEDAKPKIEFFDKVSASCDCIDFEEAAKVLKYKNIGRNKLFEILRFNNILNDNNIPYQKYIDRKYFKVIEQSYDINNKTKIYLKTLISQSGLVFISHLIENKIIGKCYA